VFAISGAEVSNLILGTCFIAGRWLKVLLDSGATHFSLSRLCVDELGQSVREFHFELLVSAPTSRTMLT